MPGEAVIDFAGESLTLLPERAVWWPAERTLVLADVHLGKAAAFRAAGIPAPEAVTAADLARLADLAARLRPERLLVLGDFLHCRSGRAEETFSAAAAWRGDHRSLAITIVRGNHDLHAGDPPDDLGLECVDPPFSLGRLAMLHDPADAADPESPALAGHLHPGLVLRDATGSMRLRAPCFLIGPRLGILPAFGSFTGLGIVRPTRAERAFAIGDGAVVEVAATHAAH